MEERLRKLIDRQLVDPLIGDGKLAATQPQRVEKARAALEMAAEALVRETPDCTQLTLALLALGNARRYCTSGILSEESPR